MCYVELWVAKEFPTKIGSSTCVWLCPTHTAMKMFHQLPYPLQKFSKATSFHSWFEGSSHTFQFGVSKTLSLDFTRKTQWKVSSFATLLRRWSALSYWHQKLNERTQIITLLFDSIRPYPLYPFYFDLSDNLVKGLTYSSTDHLSTRVKRSNASAKLTVLYF